MKRTLVLAVAGLVAVLYLPYLLDSYLIHVANVAIIFALLAVGLGICLGIAGQINLAQVAFFGVGAYTSAVLTTHAGLGFWLSAVAGVLAAVAVGWLVGVPALRVQSHYLGIVTLGLALAFTSLVSNTKLTGQAEGLLGLPAPSLFGIDLSNEYFFYYVEVAVLIAGMAFATFVVRTQLGRRLRAIRDDHIAAASIGAEVPHLRMAAFALGGLYGGLAGVLYAGLIRFVSPQSFSIANMFFLLAMVIIGGRSSLAGAIVGAIALTVAREQLVEFAEYASLGYGLIVVLVVVFAPAGLAGVPGQLRALLGRWRRRRGGGAKQGGALRPYVATATGSPEPPSEPILEIDRISKRFKGLKALDEVTISVREGEILGIVGPNGSGKTTLFNVVSGIYAPSGGRVRFVGARIARTFQNLRLFTGMSVLDNVLVALDRTRTRWAWRYVLWPVGVWRADRRLRAEAREILDGYGLSDFADVLPGTLPYGVQRRVEIARAMAAGPDVLLLDEPAAGLNGDEVRQLAAIVRDIRAGGVTVVLIEHNMGLVMSLCERVTVLDLGKVIAEGTAADVARNPRVIEAYLGSSETREVPLTAEVVQ